MSDFRETANSSPIFQKTLQDAVREGDSLHIVHIVHKVTYSNNKAHKNNFKKINMKKRPIRPSYVILLVLLLRTV